MTYDYSMTNRQRLIIIAALHQFRLHECDAGQAAGIMAEPVGDLCEEDPNAEALAIAGLMQDECHNDCLNALYA